MDRKWNLRPVAGPVALLLLLSIWGWTDEAPPLSLSLEDYQAKLQQWSADVGQISSNPAIAQELRSSLPKSIQVNTNPGTIKSSTAWLDQALDSLQKTQPDQRAELIRKIQTRLQAMQQEARHFAQSTADNAESKARLKGILARREFRSVRGPSAWQLLVERVQRWLLRLLDKIFSGVAAPAQVGQLVVWIVIAIAACVLAIWLRRKLQAAQQDVRRQPVPFAAPSFKGSRKWLAEAQAAALEGKWRDAIHLAYWAAVARLEETGAWIPDRARTPREYLRLLPARHQHRPALAELTQKFEIIWYGDRPASSADFQQAAAQLERLQCRL